MTPAKDNVASAPNRPYCLVLKDCDASREPLNADAGGTSGGGA